MNFCIMYKRREPPLTIIDFIKAKQALVMKGGNADTGRQMPADSRMLGERTWLLRTLNSLLLSSSCSFNTEIGLDASTNQVCHRIRFLVRTSLRPPIYYPPNRRILHLFFINFFISILTYYIHAQEIDLPPAHRQLPGLRAPQPTY